MTIKDRRTKKYCEWQNAVFERDNHTCKHCGVTKNLNAHHIIRWDDDENLRYEITNGLTLCVSCHAKEHHKMGRKYSKWTDEMRKKSSLILTGKKRVLPAWNKGLKMSIEQRKKLSDAKKRMWANYKLVSQKETQSDSV